MDLDKDKDQPLMLGRLCLTMDVETQCSLWSFYQYTLDDKASFPYELVLTDKGKPYRSPMEGPVHVLENGDSLVFFLNLEYKRPVSSGFVVLDFGDEEILPDGTSRSAEQFICGCKVRGLPLNSDPETWFGYFLYKQPVSLMRFCDRTLESKEEFAPIIEQAVRHLQRLRIKNKEPSLE